MKQLLLLLATSVLAAPKPDGRQIDMLRNGLTPRQHQEGKFLKKISGLNETLNFAIPRSLIAPPLAPSFKRLQNLIDNVARPDDHQADDQDKNVDAKLLPCLLRPGGCQHDTIKPSEVKSKTSNGLALKKTQAGIERAVTALQKELDMRTAEVVKEIERRAAEMRREISQEAEQLIEAVKYLVTMLADSVTRADEMGQGFVREWYDDAQSRYVGGGEKTKPLDDEIAQWDADLKRKNAQSHKSMVAELKESIQRTRQKYGHPMKELDLDDELGLSDVEGTEFEALYEQDTNVSDATPMSTNSNSAEVDTEESGKEEPSTGDKSEEPSESTENTSDPRLKALEKKIGSSEEKDLQSMPTRVRRYGLID